MPQLLLAATLLASAAHASDASDTLCVQSQRRQVGEALAVTYCFAAEQNDELHMDPPAATELRQTFENTSDEPLQLRLPAEATQRFLLRLRDTQGDAPKQRFVPYCMYHDETCVSDRFIELAPHATTTFSYPLAELLIDSPRADARYSIRISGHYFYVHPFESRSEAIKRLDEWERGHGDDAFVHRFEGVRLK